MPPWGPWLPTQHRHEHQGARLLSSTPAGWEKTGLPRVTRAQEQVLKVARVAGCWPRTLSLWLLLEMLISPFFMLSSVVSSLPLWGGEETRLGGRKTGRGDAGHQPEAPP